MSSFVVSSKFKVETLKPYVLDNIKRAGIGNVKEVKDLDSVSVRVEIEGGFLPSSKIRVFKTYMVAAFGNEVTVNEL